MSSASSGLTSISVERDTFKKAKSLKRGGESWDSLIQKMASQYDPSRETED
jgi:predicted CopG family antitoxin